MSVCHVSSAGLHVLVQRQVRYDWGGREGEGEGGSTSRKGAPLPSSSLSNTNKRKGEARERVTSKKKKIYICIIEKVYSDNKWIFRTKNTTTTIATPFVGSRSQYNWGGRWYQPTLSFAERDSNQWPDLAWPSVYTWGYVIQPEALFPRQERSQMETSEALAL